MCTTKLLSDHCFPTSSKAITSLVKRCCDVLVCSFERDDLEQVNVLKEQVIVEVQFLLEVFPVIMLESGLVSLISELIAGVPKLEFPDSPIGN